MAALDNEMARAFVVRYAKNNIEDIEMSLLSGEYGWEGLESARERFTAIKNWLDAHDEEGQPFREG